MVEAALSEGVVGRAREAGLVDVQVRDLRDYTDDRHRTVDDVAYGGGPGMVMKPAPIFAAVEAIARERGTPSAVVLMTPQGTPLHARRGGAAEPAGSPRGDLRAVRGRGRAGGRVAGHRRVVDRRLRADGRRAARAGGRRRGGAGWCRAWWATRSRWRRIRSCAGCWITRTTRGRRCFADCAVPDVLLSGHHGEIERWRRRERVRRTLERRPDLIDRGGARCRRTAANLSDCGSREGQQ